MEPIVEVWIDFDGFNWFFFPGDKKSSSLIWEQLRPSVPVTEQDGVQFLYIRCRRWPGEEKYTLVWPAIDSKFMHSDQMTHMLLPAGL